jgi:hypothetical protein
MGTGLDRFNWRHRQFLTVHRSGLGVGLWATATTRPTGFGGFRVTTYTAQNVTMGQAFMNTIIAALKTVASAALIASAKVRLSNSPSFNPIPGSTIAQLAANECAYSGYAAGGIAAVLSAPVNLSAGAQGTLISALFEATTATPFVPDTAYGWWIDDGTNFIAGEKFANNANAPFAAPGSFLSLTAIVPGQLTQATS